METGPSLIHSRFDAFALAFDLLQESALAVSEAFRRKRARANRSSRGETLRAGAGTPLWNMLAVALRAECKKRGDVARLARMVGLPRQRMHSFLHGTGPIPDAERTLMLLQWIVTRRAPDTQASEKTQ